MISKTKYGLPKKLITCKICVMTNQKPHSINETNNKKDSLKKGLDFNDDGVCAACQYAIKKKNIDWDLREKKLIKLLKKYRKNDGSYDCLVPGSGGKDSMYAAHLLKYKYNMNPLTVTFSPIQYTDIGWKNLRSWIDIGGFDNVLFSPNGKIVKILAKEAFINLLHPMQPFKFGIKTFAVKEAIKNNIDLIFYGEPYAEYGSESIKKISTPSYSEDWYKGSNKKSFLGGKDLKYYKKKYNLKKNHLSPFLNVDSNELKKKNIRVDYLGWYMKWDPQEIYYHVTKNCRFEVDKQRIDGTYGRYAGLDDKFEWIHFYAQYIKFGIGRARFDASQEIRNNHITREEGLNLCKKFENEFPKRYFKDCIDFMGISNLQALKTINRFRPPHLWKKVSNKWVFKQNNYI
jgi:N-acetyl sugar amidotransferase